MTFPVNEERLCDKYGRAKSIRTGGQASDTVERGVVSPPWGKCLTTTDYRTLELAGFVRFAVNTTLQLFAVAGEVKLSLAKRKRPEIDWRSRVFCYGGAKRANGYFLRWLLCGGRTCGFVAGSRDEGQSFLGILKIPDTDLAVVRTGCDSFASGMNGDGINPVSVSRESLQGLAIGNLMGSGILVGAAAVNETFWRNDNVEHFVAKAADRSNLFGVSDVPRADLLVAAAGDNNLAVRLKSDSVDGFPVSVKSDERISRS